MGISWLAIGIRHGDEFSFCIALMRVPGHGKQFVRVVVVHIWSISKGMDVRRLDKYPEKEIPMRS